jgi:hypothetical protein
VQRYWLCSNYENVQGVKMIIDENIQGYQKNKLTKDRLHRLNRRMNIIQKNIALAERVKELEQKVFDLDYLVGELYKAVNAVVIDHIKK